MALRRPGIELMRNASDGAHVGVIRGSGVHGMLRVGPEREDGLQGRGIEAKNLARVLQ